MDRIRLNKDEKAVLRLLQSGVGNCPDTYPRHLFTACINSLERKGLAKGAWASGHEECTAEITNLGIAYLEVNPSLRNPIDWEKTAAFTSIVALAMSLCVLCKLLIN